LVDAKEQDTKLIFRTLRNTARVLKNDISTAVVEIEGRDGKTDFKDLQPLVAGARGRAALEAGNVNDGIVTAGMVVGLINDIPSCAELIESIVAECKAELNRASSYL
jgi:NAD(P)H-dependent flavin oxidoreductase YrpB (nitropropane dioxygenase family)